MQMRRSGSGVSPKQANDSSWTATSSWTSTPSTPEKVSGCSKAGEAVGGTAALICCLPCAVINLVVLAVYKVPSGLYKRAWRRKKKLQRRRLLKKRNKNSTWFDGEGEGVNVGGIGMTLSSDDDDGEDEESESDKLEEEMWAEFYRGFWRSPSQKGD